jgi:hypothetical protein
MGVDGLHRLQFWIAEERQQKEDCGTKKTVRDSEEKKQTKQ